MRIGNDTKHAENADARARRSRWLSRWVWAPAIGLGVVGIALACSEKDEGDDNGTATTATTTGTSTTILLDDAGYVTTDAPFDACTGEAYEQELIGGPLDIYLVFDRTASMGDDCDYRPGSSPPRNSKACYATYALPDYLTSVTPQADTRLAFQFMSLAREPEGCDGELYSTPLVDLTPLPITANHEIIQAISDESFGGGFGTEIEGALRGIASFTDANQTSGREMIGVLMTDGDPNGCDGNIDRLAEIIADHRAQTGIRTFIIGMEGATDRNLETYAVAGGAQAHDDWCGDRDPPCHFWNVGDGSGDAIASALTAIVGQAAPLPCDFPVSGLTPPAGQTVDYGKVNVTLTDSSGETTIGQTANVDACPSDQLAWYYDDASAPTTIHLCANACDVATAAEGGAHLAVVLGCTDTVVIH